MSTYHWSITVRWADLDPNGHVRHSVYYDYGAQARIMFVQQQGVGIGWLAEQGIGPVIFREEARFRHELIFGDDLVIDTRLSGLSADHRKWSLRHRILRQDQVCATLDLDGAWLDLQQRRVAHPPQQLVAKFESLERTEDFRMIE